MLKIGDFSKLSQVSVRGLRFYDEQGLLKPVHVDMATGYRYYSVEQLPRLNRILALKDLGFTLGQIARILEEGLPPAHLRGMLRMKQAEIQERMQEEHVLLTRVESRLRQIELAETDATFDIVLKRAEPALVASVRDTLQSHAEIWRLIDSAYAYLEPLGFSGQCAAIWHDEEHQEHDIDAEGIVYIPTRIPSSEKVRVYELPAATTASLIHHGGYADFDLACTALVTWIDINGYDIAGGLYTIFLTRPEVDQHGKPCGVTELRFPVVSRTEEPGSG